MHFIQLLKDHHQTFLVLSAFLTFHTKAELAFLLQAVIFVTPQGQYIFHWSLELLLDLHAI